jgi:His-Xaa-Ser system radical SAM maturase HxsC
MNLYLKGYQGSFRLLKIKCDSCGAVDASEINDNIALVKDGKMIFTGQIYDCPEAEQLPEGAICSLNEQGILWELFNPEENDATIYMTGHCNSNCVMCPTTEYERRHSEGLPRDLLEQYVELLPMNLSHVTITGGEPTLRVDDFLFVLGTLKRKFPEVETLLLTNGRSLSVKLLMNKMLTDCPRHMTIGIPLHAAQANLHDSITRAKGSFTETCRGIRNLLDRHVSVEIRIVVSKLNIDKLEDIAELICAKFPETSVVHFIGLETRGNCAKNAAEVYVSPQESFRASKPAIMKLVAAGIDVGLYNFPLCMVEKGFWNLCSRSITPEKIRYAIECDTCEAKSMCSGLFYSTLSLAKPKVSPIHFQGGRIC